MMNNLFKTFTSLKIDAPISKVRNPLEQSKSKIEPRIVIKNKLKNFITQKQLLVLSKAERKVEKIKSD